MHFVKAAVQEEGKSIYVKSRIYTDECIEKMKSKEDSLNKLFESFKVETLGGLKDFEERLNGIDREILDKD